MTYKVYVEDGKVIVIMICSQRHTQTSTDLTKLEPKCLLSSDNKITVTKLDGTFLYKDVLGQTLGRY